MADKTIVYVAGDQTAVPVLYRDIGGGLYAPAVPSNPVIVGSLTLSDAAAKLVPGATSFAVRNNADTADNLLVTNAGAVAVRAGFTVTAGGLTVTAGGLTVSAGATTLVGALTLNANPILNLTGTSYLTIKDNGTNKAFIGYSAGASGILGSDQAGDLVLAALAASSRIVFGPANDMSVIMTDRQLTLGQSVAVRSGTEPTNALNIYNGTAPSGTLTNGATFYAAAGEMRVMDAAGNSTLLSPHDEAGAWIYDSTSPVTGKHLRIDMERFIKAVNERLGLDFVHEWALT